VEVPGAARFVGYVGLWPADYVADGMVEVGWRLASAHWGNGYATEAARAALRFGFVDIGLEEIVSFTVPQNIRSRRVMERIGLVRDRAGDFDHPRVDPVAYPHLAPHVLYRLSRSQWDALRAGPFPE
jgi:ribosomal-protein-alanine N-acetyltransferase